MVTSYWDTQSRPHSQPPLWLPPVLSGPVGCDGDDDNDDDASSSSYIFLSPVEKGRMGEKKRGREGGKEGVVVDQ